MDDLKNARFETRAIHAGQSPDPTTGAVVVPIYQTSTYVQEAVGVHSGYEYSRSGNPTRQALESCLAALEEGTFGLAFASGMAATDAVVRLLKPGDHVLVGNDVYGGTYRLFKRVWENYGLVFSFVDMADLAAVAAAFEPRHPSVSSERHASGAPCRNASVDETWPAGQPRTRLVWLESPTNPLLRLADISAVAELAHEHGAWLAVDNTFATPYAQRPLALGADIVVHSTTKYLSGHSDVIGGAVVVREPGLQERLAFLQNAAGAVPGPFDCWLTLRGLKTLAVRLPAHSANALAVAQYLEDHPAVARVLYPGLPSHPQHDLACRQMALFGGMLSFELRGSEQQARRLVESTRLFALGESLGGVESLIELPAVMTHLSAHGSPLAVPPQLVRLSVGIEHVDDLLADIEQALQCI